MQSLNTAMNKEKSCCDTTKSQPAETKTAEPISCCPTKKPDVKRSFLSAVKDTTKKYASVIGVFGLAVAGGTALSMALDNGFMGWMHYTMGLTFMNFALLKIGNISAFANSFEQYDLLAGKSRAYGLSYPFIEASLGAGYLAYATMSLEMQSALYATTLGITGLGTAGVVNALRNGQGDLKCACVGGETDLPLSKVAVAENVSMGGMAAIMLANMVI